MLKSLKKIKWSPYAVGLLIALLAIGSFFIFNKTLGTSTTLVKLAALFWFIIDPNHLQQNQYYQEYVLSKAWIDWQFMLVIGIFFGAYLSRKFSGQKRKYEKKTYRRYLLAFIGGIIVIFGARFAGGCTSGHAISGGVQLALSGWLFMIGVFALGIPTALILYRKKNIKRVRL